MLVQRVVTLLLLILFALLIAAIVVLVRSPAGALLEAKDYLPPLIIAGIGSATAILGRKQAATRLLCILLACMAVISGSFGDIEPGQFEGVFNFLWSALILLFGFSFTHFALVFPVPSPFVRKSPRRIWGIYALFAAGLLGMVFLPVSGIVRKGSGLPTAMQGISIFAGFLFGVVALIRKSSGSLTDAEKNRLRVVLIGCFAGAFPAVIAVLSSSSALDFGFFLLPLFPLGLVAAVLYENFSEIKKWLQQTLIYALAAAGSIACFFLSYIMAEQIDTLKPHPYLAALPIALLAGIPLVRYSRSYVSNRFCAEDEEEPFLEQQPSSRFIEPNPYIVGNPIRSPELFFGREEDFRFIRTKLQTEQQGCVIVLRGDRRTGKTSILYQIMNGRLGPDFIPVFIDMQGVVVQSDPELLAELAARICEKVQPASRDAGPEAVDSYPAFNRCMDRVMTAVGRRRLVLLMDEYELIDTRVQNGKLSSEIFAFLDSLLVRHPRLSYVFTGSKGLENCISWSSILAKSAYRDISFLARKDALALITKPLQSFGVTFTPSALNSALRLTNGHPFFTQALCQTLVEVLNDRRNLSVDRRCIEETSKRLLENAPPQLYYQWSTFSDSEKLVLSGLATSLKEHDQAITAERLDKLLRSLPGEFAKTLKAPLLRMQFEHLREKTFLDRDQTRYRFTMDLVRLWIQNEHNVWQVLNEIADRGLRIAD